MSGQRRGSGLAARVAFWVLGWQSEGKLRAAFASGLSGRVAEHPPRPS